MSGKGNFRSQQSRYPQNQYQSQGGGQNFMQDNSWKSQSQPSVTSFQNVYGQFPDSSNKSRQQHQEQYAPPFKQKKFDQQQIYSETSSVMSATTFQGANTPYNSSGNTSQRCSSPPSCSSPITSSFSHSTDEKLDLDTFDQEQDESCADTVEDDDSGYTSAPPPITVIVKDHKGQPIAVQPIQKFTEIINAIPHWLARGIDNSGYKFPMPVQQTAIPLLLDCRDVIGIAPTGSGKTVAFAIPALSNLEQPHNNKGKGKATPEVLVLCPTRELVQQTHKVFVTLSAGGASVSSLYGGQDRDQQMENLKIHGADVVIATPGRLCDILESDVLSLERLNFLVLDEADRMLEMGFSPQLAKIMSCVNPKRFRITMMWSATWSPLVNELAMDFLSSSRVMINVEGDGNHANKDIVQRVYSITDQDNKLQKIEELYQNGTISMDEKVLIFTTQKTGMNEIAETLTQSLGFPPDRVQILSGSLTQRKRSAIIARFKQGYIRILVATDVAARGLDVPEINHVINFDLPIQFDSYVHRIGRTGRAGKKGTSHTFINIRNYSTIVGRLSEYFAKNRVSYPLELRKAFRISRERSESDEAMEKEKARYAHYKDFNGADWRGYSNSGINGSNNTNVGKGGEGSHVKGKLQTHGERRGGGEKGVVPSAFSPNRMIPPAPPISN